MGHSTNLEELENSVNIFLQTETHLNDPVRILSVKKMDRAGEVIKPKSPAKRDVMIFLEARKSRTKKNPILGVVQNKIYKISFTRSVRFGIRFHLELADGMSTVEKNQHHAPATSTDSITEGPNSTKAWTESQSLRQKGWAVEKIPRKLGSVTDKFYYHLMSGYQFRSKKQALEFVSNGTPPRKNNSKAEVHEVNTKRGKRGISAEPDGNGNTDKEGYGNDRASMELGNAEEIDQAAFEEKEHLEDEIISVKQTDTANDDGKKEADEVKATGEENQKDSETVALEETKTEETEKLAKDDGKGESNEPVPNGKSVASEVNEESNEVAGNEKTETEKTSKKHPRVADEAVAEPDTKKTKTEGEQVNIHPAESSAWERPFPPEFYAEMETYDCDTGRLWHFDDPYFIELVQEGNPTKDVAYVSLKRDKKA